MRASAGADLNPDTYEISAFGRVSWNGGFS